MEEPLWKSEDKKEIRWGTGSGFLKELKKISYIGAPMVAVSISENLLQVVSVIMAGHLGQLSLSGVALAVSFTNVTGFSLLFGVAGALETLCGQAYGAEQYHRLGTYTYCAMIFLSSICFPISLLWIFLDKVLISMGQDPLISIVACRYAIGLIPALFGYAVHQSLIRYLQSQSLIVPMLMTSVATLCVHIPVCWALVFKLGLGSTGAALAMGLSYWFNVLLLAFHMRYSSSLEKTRTLIPKDMYLSFKGLISFGIPSAAMACLEWWSFEIIILLSGLLPNSKLETSVLSIWYTAKPLISVYDFLMAMLLINLCGFMVSLTTTTFHYFIPYSIGAAASTRVSNELGAGNPTGARAVMFVVGVLTIAEAAVAGTTLFCCRYILGYAYSNDRQVINYVVKIAPLLSLSVIMDSSVAVLSGVARGSGWQHIGAYVNLGAYYLVGIPVAAILCFCFGFRGKGLWIGILTGTTVQAALLAIITSLTNWQKQANKAKERLSEGGGATLVN